MIQAVSILLMTCYYLILKNTLGEKPVKDNFYAFGVDRKTK